MRVDESVHRVDDDSADAVARRVVLENVIHDGDEVSEALAGTSAGGEDVGLAAGGDADSLLLVDVQAKGLPGASIHEKAGAEGMQQPLGHQFGHGAARRVSGVELQKRLRPEHPLAQPPVDELADTVVPDIEETAHVGVVIFQYPLT